MTLMSLSIIEKLTSSLFFLISGIIWKKLLTHNVNHTIIFYRTIFSIFFIVLSMVAYSYFDFFNYSFNSVLTASWIDWITVLGICFFSFWGLYFYTSAIQTGRYSFVSSLTSLSAFFSFIISLMVYDEPLNVSKGIAIGIIVIGLLVHQKENLMKVTLSKEVLFIILCSVFWGISFVFYLLPIKKFGVLNFSLILECCVFISAVFLVQIKEKKRLPSKVTSNTFFYCVLIGLAVAAGSLLNNLTLTQIPVSYNISIGLFFEAIILLVGLYLFNEKLVQKDWILLFVIAIGSGLLLF